MVSEGGEVRFYVRFELRYLRLPQPEDKIQCTYVWIDGTGENLRNERSSEIVFFIVKMISLQSFKIVY